MKDFIISFNTSSGFYRLYSNYIDEDRSFSSNILVQLEYFEKSLGSFLVFDERVQGFTDRNLLNEAVTPVRITALD